MNNNELRFDPQTGQPLQNTTPTGAQVVPQPMEQPVPQPMEQPAPQTMGQPAPQQINVVPTIEQTESEFINNAQAVSSEQQEEKGSGLSYAFVIILFAVVLVAILFLFPIISKYI